MTRVALLPLAALLLAGCSEPADTAAETTEAPVNGCTSQTSEDHRADPAHVVVKFDATQGYTPRCVRILRGATVEFQGDFAASPLVGGTVEGGVGKAEPASPIGSTDDPAAKVKVVVFAAGSYGFFSPPHVDAGMFGGVLVARPSQGGSPSGGW